MRTTALPRPKRLWVISIMNIAVATITLVALGFMLASDRVPVEVRPTTLRAAVSGLLAGFLIISSVLALLGYPKARWPALMAAVIFFGILLLQSLLFIIHPSDVLPEGSSPKLWANVVRNTIEISLNMWVFLGAKVTTYLRGADPPT
jgi:hypothetical protein